MKLAILGTRGIPAQHGGFETFAEELSIRLAAEGHEITVFCPSGQNQPDQIYRGVRQRFVKLRDCGVFSQMLWDAKCFFLSAGQYDIVYMLGNGGSFFAWWPRLFGDDVWINNDGLEWKRAKWNLFGRAYLFCAEAMTALFASLVIADSREIASYLNKKYRGLIRTHTIAYGAYPSQTQPAPTVLEPWGLQAGQYDMVVCRLEPENHLLEIVRGYQLSRSPYPLIILGNISNPNPYVRQLLAHQSDRIRFLGTVYDPGRLEQLRLQARVYIHGHSVGGTNPSLLEAMACSNRIIAHDNPFNREVIEDAGLFFSSEKQLAEAVDTISDNPEESDRMRRKAHTRICQHYRWEQITEAYQDLMLSRL